MGDDGRFLKFAQQIALSHHEKWDDSGYPQSLAGEDIPLAARIMAIADVYDALTSERPYKSAYSSENALQIMQKKSGKHFQPTLLETFIQLKPELIKVAQNHPDKGVLAFHEHQITH